MSLFWIHDEDVTFRVTSFHLLLTLIYELEMLGEKSCQVNSHVSECAKIFNCNYVYLKGHKQNLPKIYHSKNSRNPWCEMKSCCVKMVVIIASCHGSYVRIWLMIMKIGFGLTTVCLCLNAFYLPCFIKNFLINSKYIGNIGLDKLSIRKPFELIFKAINFQ